MLCVFDGSLLFFFKLFLFFPPLRCLEMMLQASPNEKPCCWNFAADNLFLFLFFSPRHSLFEFLSPYFGESFFSVSPVEEMDVVAFLFCVFFGNLTTVNLVFNLHPVCLESQLQRYPLCVCQLVWISS